ncbi:NINE protein [Helicobacter japonicus]|uniref:NINE protein n=1 Tax=Helicobacter japonicus TaxID=425400 RepID=A0A4U8TQH6_9HELI|nr:NINE protein [Helicobacter japonicus]TLE02797.1 NINE protein [Helicobacter japonicus]
MQEGQETQGNNGALQASIVGENWKGKVTKDSLSSLQGRLAQIKNANSIGSLGFLQLKSPVVGLILGLLFGGFAADRFYKGDVGLGILKLLVVWGSFFMAMMVGAFSTAVGAVAAGEAGAAAGMVAGLGFGFVGFLIGFFWILLDLLLVWKGIKRDNFNKINTQLLLCGV